MTDDDLWKRRFLLVTLVRLVGTTLALLGMVVAFGDLVQPGGNRALGLVLIAAGLVALSLGPRMLSRRWRQP